MLRSDAGTRIENRVAKRGLRASIFHMKRAHDTPCIYIVIVCICKTVYATVWSDATPYICININHRTNDKTVTFNVLNAYCSLYIIR